MKSLDTINANNFKITNLATPTADADAATKEYVDDNGGGTDPNHAYYSRLAALLEPDAIEPFQKSTFSYAVASNVTKYLIASFNTRIGAAGRMEVRDPHTPMPMRGFTLNGIGTDAAAIILDPALPSYADARTTYFDRLETLHTSVPKVINIASGNGATAFLPGAYGAIILRAVNFDYTWVILQNNNTWGINLGNEESDSAPQRMDTALLMPVNKTVANKFLGGTVGTSASLVYVLLPSTWSTVTDPLAPYTFRDDFMGASLDTSTVWTRAQSTAGNVEIDTTYQWLKMAGNGSWGNNGVFGQTGYARSGQPVFLADAYLSAGSNPGILGWHDGGGHSYTDMAHGVYFSGGNIQVFENGNSRGNVGSGYGNTCTYRVRITALTGGGATYEIQGGTQYNPIGHASWTNITPGTSTSATNTLHPGAVVVDNATTMYVSDVRVYT